jgi:sucrose-6-phosphate hydrolase SacC (GH32 family)
VGRTFYDPAKKRQILWGWVAEEGSAPHKGEDWSSIQSLPRSVEIDPTNSSRLMFPPIEELQALRGAPIAIASTSVGAGAATKLDVSASLDQMEILINITADFTKPGVQAGVSVMGGVNVTIGSLPTPNAEGVNLLKLQCGSKVGQSVIGPSSSEVSLRIFLDKSSIEAYAAGGRGVASHRVYPTADQLQSGVQLVNTGSVPVAITGTAWPMAEAKRPSVPELLN